MKKKLFSLLGISLLLAGIVYAATSMQEIEGFLNLRATDAQIRANGTVSIVNATAPTTLAVVGMARPLIVTTASARVLTPFECGAVVVANGAAANQAFTLPAVTNAGCKFTFVAGFIDGTTQTVIKSAAAAICVFTRFAAVGADADSGIISVANCATDGIMNTAATNAIGDSITLISDGTRWIGVGISSGIWAQLA